MSDSFPLTNTRSEPISLDPTNRVAVVGAGIAGNFAARLIATRARVTLFEVDPHPGGHTHTVLVDAPEGPVPVDTGFMVFNNRTYPGFCALLDRLEVPSQPSDMTFSVKADGGRFEYQGGTLGGLFAQRANLVRPRFWRMLRDILRFNRRARVATEVPGELGETTLGEFFRRCRLGEEFRQHYFVPMTAAIWSAAPGSIEALPAHFMLGFLRNHGLLTLTDQPIWRTVTGGAKRYVERLLQPLGESVRCEAGVEHLVRRSDCVELVLHTGQRERFDEVVLACHADQSLRILGDSATPREREVLRAFPYQRNTAYLHSDSRVMPTRRRAWASWNYHLANDYRTEASARRPVSVTYHLNRLQKLPTSHQVFLTLNPTQSIDPQSVHRTMEFTHPAFTAQGVAMQDRWGEVSGVARVHYCGAYWGHGFHEDGLQSGLRVAQRFGATFQSLDEPVLPPVEVRSLGVSV